MRRCHPKPRRCMFQSTYRLQMRGVRGVWGGGRVMGEVGCGGCRANNKTKIDCCLGTSHSIYSSPKPYCLHQAVRVKCPTMVHTTDTNKLYLKQKITLFHEFSRYVVNLAHYKPGRHTTHLAHYTPGRLVRYAPQVSAPLELLTVLPGAQM